MVTTESPRLVDAGRAADSPASLARLSTSPSRRSPWRIGRCPRLSTPLLARCGSAPRSSRGGRRRGVYQGDTGTPLAPRRPKLPQPGQSSWPGPPISAPRVVPCEAMGTAGNGKCTDCGRDCHEVTHQDLGGWIVDVGGALICTACSAAHPRIRSGERLTPRTAATPSVPRGDPSRPTPATIDRLRG